MEERKRVRLAQSNPSLKGDSVLDPGILDAENEGSWGWGGVVWSLSRSSSVPGGKGGAGVFQLGLIPAWRLPSCVALAKSLALRDLLSS